MVAQEVDRGNKPLLSSFRKALRSRPPQSEAEMVADYLTLRAVIGAIAFFLVPVIYFGNWLIFTRHIGDCLVPTDPRIPGSLSGFYYSHMRGLFVGAMCAMGAFLVAYRGSGSWDSRLTNVAGLAAICIALSPTMPPTYAPLPNGPNRFFDRSNLCGPTTLITYHQSPDQRVFGVLHVVSLVVLFAMVFLMVLVQFTKTIESEHKDRPGGIWASLKMWWKSLFDSPNPRKQRRNRVYVFCAGWIAISGLLAIVSAIWPSVGKTAPLLLFAEALAFVFFGVAWYVKGAASLPADHPQLLGRVMSWTVRRWLADNES
jgi:hypothetical protein